MREGILAKEPAALLDLVKRSRAAVLSGLANDPVCLAARESPQRGKGSCDRNTVPAPAVEECGMREADLRAPQTVGACAD